MAQAQTQAPKLSPQQRAQLFAQGTRRNFQMLPGKQVSQENQQVEFELPKTRLLSKVWVEVDATATLVSDNATIPTKPFSPYGMLRRVSLDLNNGFTPYVVSGEEAYIYNMDRLNPEVGDPSDSVLRGMAYQENGADTSANGGADAKIKFVLELPVTLNERDTTGLVLLQNAETQVTLSVDVDRLEKAYAPAAGDEVQFKNCKITPMVETFSIPQNPQAFPDLSVLKLVSARNSHFDANGQTITELQTGTIYRKLFLYFEDENGNPLENEDFQSNIELIFNQADTPYSIKPSLLSAMNHSQLGKPLPKGVYVFDFSNQGIPNYGGSRDYIDTERITEFWLRFSSQKKGKVRVISENLSRLR